MSLEEEIVDYKENIEDILHWTTIKGEYRYCSIIEFLRSKGIECNWKNVTNYMRYDKRILVNSFKYIVLLEEVFKSFVCKYSKYSREEILGFSFKRAINEYINLGTKGNYDGIDVKSLRNNKENIIDFRNSVAHNKMLLNRTFEKDKSLEETLRIYCEALPKSYRLGFKSDINKSVRGLVENSWQIEI